ncbi:cytochrome c oxidase subunit 3 [Streptomyces sp. ODS28]|uniref:cytochrome c oxidase subunit 3 n=1 Tax=Streptomyces sp. ODS28 TaxID=3136688 RepID=UPI0031E7B24D
MHDAENSTSTLAEKTEKKVLVPRRQPDTGPQARWLPGEVGIWVFVFTDLMMFSAYFAALLNERAHHAGEFTSGRAALNTDLGALNTFLMLTASLCIALAVHAVRESAERTVRRLLLGSGICGALFIVNKGIEWSSAAGAGHTPQTNVFFQMYYMLTGIHLLHVIIAMIVLAYLWRTARRMRAGGTTDARHMRFFENGATFWHLTDALWIVLFTLFYLVR